MLLKLLLFVILLLVIRMVLSKLFGGRPIVRIRTHVGTRQARPNRTISGETVKDPQCGMYVAKQLAVASSTRGQTLYFCSPECRDAYLRAK